MKNLAKFLVLAIFPLVFATCASAQVTWTFNDVTFNDGETVTGSFTTNSAGTMVENLNVVLSGPNIFTIVNTAYLPDNLGFASSGWSQYIDLYLDSPLSSTGGTIGIGSGYDCPDGCGVLNVGGAYDPTITGVTPEPSTAGLMLLGVALLLGTRFVMRNRRATNQTWWVHKVKL